MKVKKLEISDNISVKDMFETSVKSNSIWVVYYNTDIIFGLPYTYIYIIIFITIIKKFNIRQVLVLKL